jgi:hypothetical protein
MMKKYLLLLCYLLVLTTTHTLAENRASIFISPGLSFGHVHTDPDNAGFHSNSVGFGGKLGALYDWNIKDNYYLSSGLVFVVQQIGFKNDTEEENKSIVEQHKIQHLHIPLLVKLYTDELSIDFRCYAVVGLISAFKVNSWVSHANKPKPFITELNVFNLSGHIGIGAEYQLSLSTSVFAGLSYQLGLRTLFAAQRKDPKMPPLSGYGHIITLDIGIVV